MNSINPFGFSLVIILVVCLVVGYVVGWLVATLLGDRKKDRPAEEPKTGPQPAPAAPPQPPALLRIARDLANGELQMEMRGKLFPRAESLSLDERRQMIQILQEVSLWLKKGPVTTPAGQPQAARSEAQPAASGGLKMPSMTGAIADALNPPAKPPEGAKKAPLSVVQQIDAILQAKIAGTALEKMRIYMAEDSRQNVVVYVGNAVYQGLDAIPEGEIKELIKACAREWEQGAGDGAK